MSSDLFKFVFFADDSTLTASFNETDGKVMIMTAPNSRARREKQKGDVKREHGAI